MAECRSFVSAYPVDTITQAEKRKIPRTHMHFQHDDVEVKVDCYSPNAPGQSMPDWLVYLAEHFGQLRFIDAYTFHVAKHFLLSNDAKLRGSEDAQGFDCVRTVKWTFQRKTRSRAIDFAM